MSKEDQTERPTAGAAESRFAPQLRYWLSLPERTLRSGTGLMAGAVRESAALLVPRSFQDSQTYTVMVRQMLDFLAEDMGGVERAGVDSSQPEQVDNFLARKAAGNFLEMAALATFHLSPLTVLAIFSDVAYGSQTYLNELSTELKKQGIIDEQSTIDHAGDLLAAVAESTRSTARAFNTPPLSVEGLKETIEETRAAVGQIRPDQLLPEAEIRRLWDQMRELAQRDKVNLLQLSGAVTIGSLGSLGTLAHGALSSVRVTGALAQRHIFEHYSQSLARIRAEGLYHTLAETSAPYMQAVWHNFSPDRSTITEDILSGKLPGTAWKAMRRWLGGKTSTPQPDPNAADEVAEAPDKDSPAEPSSAAPTSAPRVGQPPAEPA